MLSSVCAGWPTVGFRWWHILLKTKRRNKIQPTSQRTNRMGTVFVKVWNCGDLTKLDPSRHVWILSCQDNPKLWTTQEKPNIWRWWKSSHAMPCLNDPDPMWTISETKLYWKWLVDKGVHIKVATNVLWIKAPPRHCCEDQINGRVRSPSASQLEIVAICVRFLIQNRPRRVPIHDVIFPSQKTFLAA